MTLNNYTGKLLLLAAFSGIGSRAQSQYAVLKGTVTAGEQTLAYASVLLQGSKYVSVTDTAGQFRISNIPPGTYKIKVSAVGYETQEKTLLLKENETNTADFTLAASASLLSEVVVSGTLKEVLKLDSPVPVEVYTASFFKSNPVPSVFDALQQVNGVRPQLNCNVCNTGDIHINGLEGPYTMVLVDGMPVVSGLSAVYGLFGIPQSLIDRVEIVKGPASTLYGSEAVGGLVNIITKKPGQAPLLSADVFGTTWGELNADLAGKFNAGKKTQCLAGLNYFNYTQPADKNNDGFTDVTLQNRVSVFSKWTIERSHNRVLSLAGRYIYENRWGGEMNWSKAFRGGDSIYGESIYTKRWEFFGTYQLPVKEKILFQFSATGHDQNSAYGTTPFIARQTIGFGQLTWNKRFHLHDLLTGATFRYTYYDDNTPATSGFDSAMNHTNRPAHSRLPGIFVQDEISISDHHKLLLGMRYDHHSVHGSIFTPRINYKWSSPNKKNVLRLGIGNGYRVASVFTEDHAALTGARTIVFREALKPETSWNGNINFVKKLHTKKGVLIGLDASAFYTYFRNKIIADYDTNPNEIIYDNLEGHAVSRGISVNTDLSFPSGLKITAGGTYMDVYSVEAGVKAWQLFSERFTGVWNIGYPIRHTGLSIDYTGTVYSPMRLPLLGEHDPRKEFSPWWSIQNIQLTKKFSNGFELYGGVKNLLNWTPARSVPFIIARANDPFDKEVQFDTNGQAMVTPGNPYGLTFDPAYVYGPNQGIRAFLGLRYQLK